MNGKVDDPVIDTPGEKEAQEIREKSDKVRENLADGVENLKTTVEQAFDYKHYLREHPIIAVSAAAGIGYVLAPRFGSSSKEKEKSASPIRLQPTMTREAPAPQSQWPTPPTSQQARRATETRHSSTPAVKLLTAIVGDVALQAALVFISQQMVRCVGNFASHPTRESKSHENKQDGNGNYAI